jgi:hypothetical protein
VLEELAKTIESLPTKSWVHEHQTKEANKSLRTNRPYAFQFHFNHFPTAPVGAHQTFGFKLSMNRSRLLVITGAFVLCHCSQQGPLPAGRADEAKSRSEVTKFATRPGGIAT